MDQNNKDFNDYLKNYYPSLGQYNAICPTCRTCPTCGRVQQQNLGPYWGISTGNLGGQPC